MNIRKPDPIKRDKLIEDTEDSYFFQSDLENRQEEIMNRKAIENSIKEYEEEQEKALQLEIEKVKRKSLFNNVKNYINKFLNIDKDNKELYEIILSKIELYENDLLLYHTENQVQKNCSKLEQSLKDILKTMRLSIDEKKAIHCLFFCPQCLEI